MLDDKVLIDIGNTSVDISCGNNFFKFYKENTKDIIDKIDSLQSKKLCISSVNKKTLFSIYKYYKKRKYEIDILDNKKMVSYARKNNYSIPNIDILGSDLFCDIVCSYNNVDNIIIDLGTVGKILAVDKNKVFLGGMIIPGITSFPKSVTHSTDLNIKEFGEDDFDLLNYDTDKCVFSGSVNGISSMIFNLIERIINKYNLINAKIILCGGNSKFVKNILLDVGLADFEFRPKLVLEGLNKIYTDGGENENQKD